MGGRVLIEEDESQATSAPVKLMEAKKDIQNAWLLMFFMLIGLNASWVFAQSLTSDIEVNKEGVEHQTTEAFEVPDMMLMSKQVPAEIICSSSLDPGKTANGTNVSWKLSDSRGKIVHSFSGKVGDGCNAKLLLQPGLHRMTTTVEYGVQIEQTVKMQVWKGLSKEGHIIASMMAFLFPLPTILAAHRRGKRIEHDVPIARARRYEDWETIHREMEDRDRSATEIHDLNPYLGKQANLDQSYVLTKPTEEERPTTKDVPDIAPVSQPKADDTGTMKGLVDPLSVDERIQKVGDIYDLMKDDD
jgi:hypothetical protein|tara:strand:- start:445 stop:1350 length:906 start_codon:yes stop_codon:yes gene_type:complete